MTLTRSADTYKAGSSPSAVIAHAQCRPRGQPPRVGPRLRTLRAARARPSPKQAVKRVQSNRTYKRGLAEQGGACKAAAKRQRQFRACIWPCPADTSCARAARNGCVGRGSDTEWTKQICDPTAGCMSAARATLFEFEPAPIAPERRQALGHALWRRRGLARSCCAASRLAGDQARTDTTNAGTQHKAQGRAASASGGYAKFHARQ